ncbi:DNA replication/repair protein RecF [Ignavigranum ruoffiae]
MIFSMFIDSLQLQHYRNYDSLELEFHQGLTILTGENAQGKTNLLEAIFLLSLAKSHRTNHDHDLIQWGQDYASIQAQVHLKDYTFPLELILHPKGKVAKVNYIEQAKLSAFIGKLNVVLFAPEDLQMIKGGPSLRRKFMDAELGQAHPLYLQSLVKYQTILKQRNKYLKDYGQSSKFDHTFFEVLTDQLIDEAFVIISNRLDFIDRLMTIAQPIHRIISNQRDKLTMAYQSSIKQINYGNLSQIKTQMKEYFENNIDKEKERMLTLIGPHRDDLIFYINNRQSDLFASQGQQRTIILSLKLAETELFQQFTGEYPILLLDDVLSELDDNRQHLLMNHIEDKIQTFLTTATIKGIRSESLQHAQILQVHQGIINEL